MKKTFKISLLTSTLLSFTSALALSLTGAGSSAIYPVMSEWANVYHGAQVNYQSIGSGGGLSQLKQSTIEFAAVDMPQNKQTLKQHHWMQFPIIGSGIVVAVHVNGIRSNQLRLTGPVLAKIYAGKITHWNNPEITKLNKGLALPSAKILVIHRADGSGTTYNFSYYLSKVSKMWNKNYHFGTTVNWATGIGAKGSSGVAMFLQRMPNSIGYVDYSYVTQNHLTPIELKNAAGHFVSANSSSFSAALSKADWHSKPNFNVLVANAPGAHSWPLTATTFALVPTGKQAKQGKAIRDFFTWCYSNHGAVLAKPLSYVPLPASVVSSIKHYWHKKA